MINLMQGDCLERMKEIPDGSVDMILTDPPYFKKVNEKWDKRWKTKGEFLSWVGSCLRECVRCAKPSAAIVIFAPQEFSHNIANEIEVAGLRVETNGVWVKPDGLGAEKGLKAGLTTRPISKSERFVVGRSKNPLGDTLRAAMQHKGVSALEVCRQLYNKETGIVSLWLCDREAWGACIPKKSDWVEAMRICGKDTTEEDYDFLKAVYNHGYQDYDLVTHDNKVDRKYHPTQKPILLIEDLIKTYTNEGETVLDFTMGSGTTGVAAKNLNRSFIGIELDEEYFKIAQERISAT